MERADVAHLAKLARLSLTEEELSRYQQEITDILGYVTQLNTVAGDIDGPIESAGVRNVLRDDTAPQPAGTYTEALLAAAPETHDGFVKVQKILDTGHGA
jgi:aspartyl-tRNA(Asn)/glutamyl-tRNA(Gln) amidotransferase subunit C